MCHGHRSREWSREETDESTDEPAEEPSLSEPEEATDVEILTDGGDE
ncbi:hypothetical protein [Halorubrum sp. Atlit-28R]|jgi:hypothetical protein|nr:hypothetical protein [Halorubrum sp. Atlit-28R]